MDKNWILSRHIYNHNTRQSMEPVFTIGNGYICARGFFEEEQDEILGLGGIYIAGVLGSARYTPWKGEGRELANTPNIFYTSIVVDGEQVIVNENILDFDISLNMKESKETRSYIWQSKSGKKIRLEFQRFLSAHDIHIGGQKIKITPLDDDLEISIQMDINTNVKNLNYESCEPLPIQPGVRHIKPINRNSNIIEVCIENPDRVDLVYGQKVEADGYDNISIEENHEKGYLFNFKGEKDRTAEFTKLIYTYTSNTVDNPLDKLKDSLETGTSYETEFTKHCKVWTDRWNISDVQIQGNDEDQVAVRYNIFQLIQACPEHTTKLSIGARGLTGEMYEGCVFWDTEIFMVPFFTLTNPEAARGLLKFRYHTLGEAKEHAKSNFFKGAMYGWQVSEKGIEQTPQNVGAYYSIHVIADIAFAILDYWFATYDEDFIASEGLEILIETARYWESRVKKNSKTHKYEILAVRGPNEYGVIVHNNVYTNMMAQQNLLMAIDMIEMMKEKHDTKWNALKEKLCFDDTEIGAWQDIADNMTIAYNEDMDLYEEDDRYLYRMPLDMKKAKPTAKRIIDSTMPYEALPLYQVTKQPDVLHLMKNLHWKFTKEQVKNAWDYYVPRTAHDSSLSYSIHSIIAAKLGMSDIAYEYFNTSANLDIKDVKLNTISGLHFANFGGTWQSVVFGFGGLSIDENNVNINPSIPEKWDSISYKFWYKKNIIKVTVSKDNVNIEFEKYDTGTANINLFGKSVILDEKTKSLVMDIK